MQKRCITKKGGTKFFFMKCPERSSGMKREYNSGLIIILKREREEREKKRRYYTDRKA